MFSITTMASSTTMPVASTMPKSVRVLIEKPNSLMKAKVPISETGIVIAGITRAAPVLQEQEHHEDDEGDRLGERLQHLDDRLAHDDDVVEGEPPLEPGREVALQARHLGHHAVVHLERVGRGQQLDADARGVQAEEAQVRRVGLGAELDAADVAHAHQRAVGAGLHDDVLELVGLGQAAGGADADGEELVDVGRRVADGAGGDLDVLLAQRGHDVAGRDLAGGELLRVEPQPHRVLALAEDDHVADAGHALQARRARRRRGSC